MYLLSIMTVIILTGLLCILTNGMGGNYLTIFLDFPTLFFLVLAVVPLLMSGGLLKDFNNAFRLGIGKKEPSDVMELIRARESVNLTIKILVAASVFICVVGGVLLMHIVEKAEELGPSIAVTLLPLVYGGGVAIVLLPLQARLNIKIQEFTANKECREYL